MRIMRVAAMLMAAVGLVAAACGTEPAVVDPQPEAEAPAEPPAPGDAATGNSEEGVAESPASGDAATGDSEGQDEPVRAEAGEDAAFTDAETLLASATTQLVGRSVRGEAVVELAPGFSWSTTFESDGDGNLAAIVEMPPGLDPAYPGGAEAEVRWVSGDFFVRPPTSAETLADLGVDEAWYMAELSTGADSMNDAMGSAGGMLCIFPQTVVGPFLDCDPLGETGAFLEAAGEAEIVGREDVRGVEATRVRFTVSLLDLVGEALGMEPDEDDGEGGVFDDTASDPFAEPIEQILGFLDAGFDVEAWIDDESLIRRLEFDLASLFAGLGGPETAAEVPSIPVALEFYDFDTDIRVDAPPAGLIFDDADLFLGGDDYATAQPYEPEYDDRPAQPVPPTPGPPPRGPGHDDDGYDNDNDYEKGYGYDAAGDDDYEKGYGYDAAGDDDYQEGYGYDANGD